jgi:hypothetical protein
MAGCGKRNLTDPHASSSTRQISTQRRDLKDELESQTKVLQHYFDEIM